MKITITHARYVPSWVTLERVIKEATNEATNVHSGQLIAVQRRDGRSNYRAPGVYDLSFRQDNETVLPIELEVVGK